MVENTDNNVRYLEYLLNSLFDNSNYGICIQDTSGVLHSTPSLDISYKYKIHCGEICSLAKLTSNGLNYCSRMKAFSLSRFAVNDKAFVSRCYMGITEVAVPVFYGNKLACAIYIGSFILEGCKNDCLKRAKRYSTKLGTDYDSLESAIEKIEETPPSELENLMHLAETLARYISLLIDKSEIRFSETSHFNRVNKNSVSGVHWAVAYTLEYIDFYYNKNISLKNISQIIYVNPDYLCRLFKKHTDNTFIEYLNIKRVNEAKRMIEQSKATITEICYDVGFQNKSHFNRIFKKLCGISPRLYRKNHVAES